VFTNTKIGQRLVIGFLLIVAVFAGASIYSWVSFRKIETDTEELAGRRFQEISLASEMQRTLLEASASYTQYALSGEKADFNRGKQMIGETEKLVAEAMGLSMEHEDMEELRQGAMEVSGAVALLKNGAGKISEAMDGMDASRKEMEEALNILEKNIASYISVEQKQIRKQIELDLAAQAIMNRIDKIGKAQKVLHEAERTNADFHEAQAAGDRAAAAEALKRLSGLEETLKDLRKSSYMLEAKESLDRVVEAIGRYRESAGRFVESWTVLEKFAADIKERARGAGQSALAVNEKAFAEAEGLAEDVLDQLSRNVRMTLGVLVAVAVIGFAVSLVITKSIRNPLKALVDMAKQAGSGNLAVTVDESRFPFEDEVHEVAREMGTMIAGQRRIIEAIKNEAARSEKRAGELSALSGAVREAMDRIQKAVEELGSLTETNAASLEETNAGVEEVSGGARQVAQSASQAAELSAQTRRIGEETAEFIQGMVQEILGTSEQAEKGAASMQGLLDSVEKITSFVSTIGTIADQTNLLALNAAIEAARAGEHGRSFAVVADEVRKLAADSNKAANEIGSLIEHLSTETSESAETIMASVKSMKETAQQAGLTGENINTVIEQIRSIDDAITSMASAAQEQAAASREIAGAVEQITVANNEVVEKAEGIQSSSQSTSETSYRLAEEAQGMKENSDALNRLLEDFTLGDDGDAQIKQSQAG
jgi:methyl-accepting chemotaxis protein